MNHPALGSLWQIGGDVAGALRSLLEEGGYVMFALLLLSVLLYERCFHLLLSLARTRSSLRSEHAAEGLSPEVVRGRARDLENFYERRLVLIRAFVAAAPLLGLLGTVIGMVRTFDSLSSSRAQGAAEGLAGGVSLALLTTETGLAVAIPALVILYFAQRQLQQSVQLMTEHAFPEHT